jgi:hypothetical protein
MKTLFIRSASLAITLLLLVAFVAYAGNGKIAGTVRDAANQNPIPGANVTVQGTTLGASADAEGRYFVLNVPPGMYDVVASTVGYARAVVRGIAVSSDKTTTVDFELREAAVGLEEVVIAAEAPLVDRTRIATKTTLSRDEVSSLPVTTIFDVINTAASSYNGFVRGGRYVETKTLIDGVDVSDAYSAIDAEARGIENVHVTYSGVVRQYDKNNVQAGISSSAIEEASLNTGAVGAEYTSATAGLINISLKEGRGPLTGKLFVRSSVTGLNHVGPAVYLDQNRYIAERDAAPATTKPKYTWTPAKLGDDVYAYDASGPGSKKPTSDAELSLSGGITPDLGLFFSGRVYNTYGTFPGEFYREADLNLKSTYQISPSIKTTLFGLIRDRGKLFGWKNRSFNDVYRYLLEGVPMNDGTSITGSLKWTHLLSPSTFYEIQLSDVYSNNRLGYVDGNGDGRIDYNEDGDFLTFETKAELDKYIDKFFSSGPKNGPDLTGFGSPAYQLSGPGIYYENTKLSTYTLRADLTSQVTYNHQLRLGGQARLHDIDNVKRSSPVGVIEEKYQVKPMEFGFYAQDRMEYAGLILNVGARFDALSYNEGDFLNYFAPATKDPNPPYGISRSIAVRGDKPKVRWYFTPKIGLSHPIEDVGAVYFSFSRQMTPQPFANVFAAYNLYGTSPILPGVPRINQDPFISTNYELGGQYVFFKDFSLDVNAYFRNIENYGLDAATVVWRSPAGVPNLYTLQFSGGYADARGVELTVTKRPSQLLDFLDIYGRASYAYSYVKATSSPLGTAVNVSDATSFSTTAGDSAKYGGVFPFDDYKFYARIQNNVVGVNSTLTGGYDRTHRITASLFFKFKYDILLSVLGKFASGFYYTKLFAEPRSRELGTAPWIKQVDLRLEKGFEVGQWRLAGFVDIKNVLDSENILTYFSSPDGKGQELWEKQEIPYGPDKRATTLDGSPIYDIARQIYFGVSVNF